MISAVIVWSTWDLLSDSMAMSLNAVPPGIDPGAVRSYLEKCVGVVLVHDLHIWPMSTTEVALTGDLMLDASILECGARPEKIVLTQKLSLE